VRIPKAVAESWDRLRTDSPAEALASSHALHQAIATWQTALVQEALANGAGWEEIGVALGTSKQGAWARFRAAAGEQGGREAMQDRHLTRQRVGEIVKAGHARLREMDASWREEHEQLRRQLQESKDRFTDARRRHADERRDARSSLRREIEAARR
jgi:hypothetical protein